MLSPAQTIRRLGGIARGSHLQRLGFTRTQLARLVQEEKIQRVRAGVFATHDLDSGIRTAAAHGGAVTCASALRAHEIWVLPDDDGPHVWMGPKGRVHSHDACSCTSHFYTGIPPLGYAPVEIALVHLRRCAGDEAFFAAYESAWRKRLLSKSARSRVRQALPASARWLVEIARPDADSGLESLLRLRTHILGIHLDCQVVITGVGKVDFVLGGRLILEADGKENHDSETKRHNDRARDAAASALGYETLRFDYAQIVHDWPTVQAAILGALRRLRAR
ncbi:DUF559 domain-containing protein [Microbacterium sp. A588]